MSICEHTQTEVRARPTVSGTPQWARQCVDCGVRVGNWVKKPDGDVPAWDTAAEEAAHERRPNTLPDLTAERQARDIRWRRTYEAFLKSPDWKSMRTLVMQRADHLCEACLTNEAEHVHHTVYPKVDGEVSAFDFRNQPLWELRAVCWTCHAAIHPHMRSAA
jgi:5-methylcytosine-specific restriction endonuclease McrA